MKILILLPPLLTALSVFGQDTTKKYYPSGKPLLYQVKPDSTHLWEQTFFESGKLHSESSVLIENGKQRFISIREYYPDGSPDVLQNDSVLLRYEQDGKLIQQARIRDHKMNGISRTYLDGKLWLDVSYKDNVKEGWMTGYDSTGRVDSKAYYRANRLDGPFQYYKNDRLIKTVDYLGGCPVRVFHYDKNGKTTRVLIAKREIWLDEGKPIGCK